MFENGTIVYVKEGHISLVRSPAGFTPETQWVVISRHDGFYTLHNKTLGSHTAPEEVLQNLQQKQAEAARHQKRQEKADRIIQGLQNRDDRLRAERDQAFDEAVAREAAGA